MTIANSIFSGSTGVLILTAMYAMFSQNAVLGRALGASRLTKLVGDADGDAGIFCVLLALVQLAGGALSWGATTLLQPLLGGAWVHLRVLVMVLCTSIVFFAVFFLVVQLFKPELGRRVVRQLPIAAFNCCVVGTQLLTGSQSYTFGQTLVFNFGSAVGYMLALLLLVEGGRKLDDAALPKSFRGLPATLVYLGILSLLIYGFTGHGLVV